jgi:hypothetical protein
MVEVDSIIDSEERKKLARCFAARRWTFAAAAAVRFRALLSAWEVDAISRFVPQSGSLNFRLHFHGMRVLESAYRDANGRIARAAAGELLESGAALSITHMENYSNAVLRLSRILEAELGCPIQVNLYQTPPQGQGLGRHRDEHDVLVLQLQGEKQWQLIDPESVALSQSPVGADGNGAHEQTAILRAGNWLYLPRGIWHEVRNCGGEPSFHFTVGLHRDRHQSDFRAFAEPIAASEVPERGALDAAGADTFFHWRAAATRAVRSDGRLELNLCYRRRPLVLYSELEPIIERMARLAHFRPRDLGVEDVASSTLLARFLAGVGMLTLSPELS